MRAGHFIALDGLRGVAALAVVFFHLSGPLGWAIASHGYLAVDFFFVLSGFVVARAYEARLVSGELGLLQYLRKRGGRLYPVAFVGITLGLLVNLAIKAPFDPAWLLTFLLLPAPSSVFSFPLNNPMWSLSLEIFINIFHAIFARILKTAWLTTLVLISAIGVAFVAMQSDGLNVGWSTAPNHPLLFRYGGLIRVFYGFSLGIGIYRLHIAGKLPSLPIDWWVTAAILGGVLLAPVQNSTAYDLTCVFVIFPLLLVAGLGREPEERIARFAKVIGYISYPLYALHYPLVRPITGIQRHFIPSPSIGYLYDAAFITSLIVAAYFVAWALERWPRGRAPQAALAKG